MISTFPRGTGYDSVFVFGSCAASTLVDELNALLPESCAILDN
jgi:hypothetical protein